MKEGLRYVLKALFVAFRVRIWDILFDIPNRNAKDSDGVPVHYFNDILFTGWPFFIGCSIFVTFFYIVLFVKKLVFVTPFILLCLFYLLIFYIFDWFNEMYYESHFCGIYSRKLRSSLVCGFLFFLISEIMLFGGFFWAFFDRVFNPGYLIGSACLPLGIENVDFYRWPIVGTIVLVTSGYFANHSYYLLRAGSWYHCLLFGFLTILMAIFFLYIQLVEYNGLSFTISDNVYGSFFYLLTGFHGFHVTIGLFFLCEQYNRIRGRICCWKQKANYLYNRERHLGMAFALIYWHFVDVIWIFLFFSVYVSNNVSYFSWIENFVGIDAEDWIDFSLDYQISLFWDRADVIIRVWMLHVYKEWMGLFEHAPYDTYVID